MGYWRRRVVDCKHSDTPRICFRNFYIRQFYLSNFKGIDKLVILAPWTATWLGLFWANVHPFAPGCSGRVLHKNFSSDKVRTADVSAKLSTFQRASGGSFAGVISFLVLCNHTNVRVFMTMCKPELVKDTSTYLKRITTGNSTLCAGHLNPLRLVQPSILPSTTTGWLKWVCGRGRVPLPACALARSHMKH